MMGDIIFQRIIIKLDLNYYISDATLYWILIFSTIVMLATALKHTSRVSELIDFTITAIVCIFLIYAILPFLDSL